MLKLPRTPVLARAAGIVAVWLATLPSPVQAQSVYKHVDESGKVVYSQSPPAGTSAEKVRVSPAQRPSTLPAGRDYEADAIRRQQAEDQKRERERQREEALARQEELRRSRAAALQAECARNRGTDCNDPETIRRMEADQQPRVRPGRR